VKSESDYCPPEIGTVVKLRSTNADDPRLSPVMEIASILGKGGLISEHMKLQGYKEELRVRFDVYENRRPKRKHGEQWIDGGKQLCVFHPVTYLPFFLNHTGSRVCELCSGKLAVNEIVTLLKKEYSLVTKESITKDLVGFLLLLEELDLLEFEG